MSFIYTKKIAEGLYQPIIKTEYNEDGDVVVRSVSGYYLEKLQDYVKAQSDIPQNGYYLTVRYEMLKKISLLLQEDIHLTLCSDGKDAYLDEYYEEMIAQAEDEDGESCAAIEYAIEKDDAEDEDEDDE